MATCKDCIHNEACTSMLTALGYTVKGDGENAEERCNEFKAKSELVEVVRCKDCHWWRKINRLNGSGLCKHTVFSIDDCIADPQTNPGDFCSYGEKAR